MPRFLPGNPAIVVQNMVGAEGIRAANFLYNVAAQDGTVIGGLSRNNGLAKFYDVNNASVQFDARKFHWVGSPQQEIGLFILRTQKGAKSIEDLKKVEVVVSSTTRGAPTSIYPRMLNALYGAKIKVVDGYGGSQNLCWRSSATRWTATSPAARRRRSGRGSHRGSRAMPR